MLPGGDPRELDLRQEELPAPLPPLGPAQSRLGMPAFSITADHLAMSLFIRAVISSGVLARMSMPRRCDFSCTSGSGSASLMARLIVSMIGCGVAAGTEIPFQLATS